MVQYNNNSNDCGVRLSTISFACVGRPWQCQPLWGDTDSTLARDIMLCFAIREAKAAFEVSRFRQLNAAMSRLAKGTKETGGPMVL